MKERRWKEWLVAAAVATSALGTTQGEATAQIMARNGVARTWMMTGTSPIRIPQLREYAVEREGCMLTPNRDRVCGNPDLLEPANDSRRQAVRQSRTAHVAMYRANVMIIDTVREIQRDRGVDAGGHVVHLATDQMHTLRANIQTALQREAYTLRIACNGVEINVCVPSPEVDNNHHGENLADALRIVSQRLTDNMNADACSMGCQTTEDARYCRAYNLGALVAVDWTRSVTPDGGAPRCQPSLENGACQRRPVQALSVHTCESLRRWWGDVGARADALRIRHEADARYALVAIDAANQGHNLLMAAQTAARNTPATTPDRDGDTIADAVDQCPDTAQSEHTDPQRVGCPAPELQVAERRRSVRRHRHRDPSTAATARPTPPALGREINGMECTAPDPRGTQWMTTCVVRRSNAASANFEARAIRAEGMHATGGTLPAAYNRLARRMSSVRAVVRTILRDNPGTSRQCSSPIVLACRKTGWTRANPQYFRQRIGVCAAANGNNTPVTLESFVRDAADECEAGFHVSVWGVTGGSVRLRFDHYPNTETAAPPENADPDALPTSAQLSPAPSGTAQSEAQVAAFNDSFPATADVNAPATTNPATPMTTMGTARVSIASRTFVHALATASRLARLLPPMHLNVRSAEVTARSGTTTDDENVSEIGPPRRACPVGSRCWWLRPTSAIA